MPPSPQPTAEMPVGAQRPNLKPKAGGSADSISQSLAGSIFSGESIPSVAQKLKSQVHNDIFLDSVLRSLRAKLSSRFPQDKVERIISELRKTYHSQIKTVPSMLAGNIYLNQAFYLPKLPKTGLIRLEGYLPANTIQVDILDSTGKKVSSANVKELGQYKPWGSQYYYYAVDFSGLNAQGRYQLLVKTSAGSMQSLPFQVSTQNFDRSASLVMDFFRAQECGREVPGWHGPCHMDDPAAGGFHDAGDYGKYIYTQAGSVMALWETSVGARNSAISQRAKEEALWGYKFLAGMVKPDGDMYSEIYKGMTINRPEKDTDNIKRNSDDRRLTSGYWGPYYWAIGISSAAFAYSAESMSGAEKDKAIGLAEKTFKFAYSKLKDQSGAEVLQGKGGLLISAVKLYKLTHNEKYHKEAKNLLADILSYQDPTLGFFADKPGGGNPFWQDYEPYMFVDGLSVFADAFPTDPLSAKAKKSIALLADKHILYLTKESPYGQEQWRDDGDSLKKDGKNTVNFYPPQPYMGGITRGQNSYYLSSAYVLLKAYQYSSDPTKKEAYLKAALSQVDWIFGKNPYGISMMYGMGNVFPSKYHHRYATIPGHSTGAVPGGILNGIGCASINGDKPYFDRIGNQWQTTEPWISHDEWYLRVWLELQKIK